jgi:hypothetical protein
MDLIAAYRYDTTIIIILNGGKTESMGPELNAKLWLTNHLESESGYKR